MSKKDLKVNLIKVFTALTAYISILYYNGAIESYRASDFFNMLLIIPIFLLYFKNNKVDKRTNKYSKILGITSGVLFSFNFIVKNIIYINEASLITMHNAMYFILLFTGFSSLFYRLFLIVLPIIKRIDISNNENVNLKKQFIIYLVIILICWLPYFLYSFPGVLTVDSYTQINQIEQNVFSNWYPACHTFLIKIFYSLGKFIFGSSNAGIAIYTIFQMIFLAGCFSLLSTYILKLKYPKWISYIAVAYFAVSPLHATFSVTMWKDIIYGGLSIILILVILKLINSSNKKRTWLLLGVISLLFSLSRNNGIYIIFFLFPFMAIYFKKNIKYAITTFTIVIALFFIITGPIYNNLRISKTPITEALSIPLNQMARVMYKNGNINNKEKSYVSKLMQVDLISNKYSGISADPIKSITNYNIIEENKIEFIKNWASILMKNPIIYVESFLVQTSGFWNESVYDIPIFSPKEYEPISSKYNIKNINLMPKSFNVFFGSLNVFKTPLLQLFYSSGLMFYFLIISFIVLLYRKNYKYWIIYIPLFGVWLTIMIATPVYASARYVYPLFTCLPLLLVIPLINEKNKRKEKFI